MQTAPTHAPSNAARGGTSSGEFTRLAASVGTIAYVLVFVVMFAAVPDLVGFVPLRALLGLGILAGIAAFVVGDRWNQAAIDH